MLRPRRTILLLSLIALIAQVSAWASEKVDSLAAARTLWTFQPPQRHPLPGIQNSTWPRQALDYFILAQLEKKGLGPSAEANRLTLVRRLYLDLTGLPPTPAQVQSFLADPSENAYQRLVDELLSSPRFGERLASLWLNVSRYAEDQAHLVDNDKSPFYPNAHFYRAWVIGAFNRDLPYDQFIRLQLAADLIATNQPGEQAALGFVGLGPKYYSRETLEVMADEWEERVDTVSRSFLGLTIACARCHDHKYDPITMEDYYGLAGVFASTRLVNKFSDGREYKDPENKKERIKAVVPANVLHVLEDGESKDLNVFARGNVEAPGSVVARRFPAILCQPDAKPFTQGSGRAQLAEAIADPRNPLTARVMVNRLWGIIFGRPLLSTPSNFGALADPPSHPELLDTLAVEFMQGGWSIKHLLRQFVLSATYRQSSANNPQVAQHDPGNQSFWRMNRRRMTVEQWRDGVLSAVGNLEFRLAGSFDVDDPSKRRRTVYGRVSRLALSELHALFDYPDPNVHAEGRPLTTTPMQKLYVLNAPFLMQQAEVLADRLMRAVPDNETRIARAYELLYSRTPTPEEVRAGKAFLEKNETDVRDRWIRYAHILLSANEFLYVE